MPPKNEKAWRDEFVSKGEFACACGCALQLSKGDLADAMRVAARFGGKPRTGGVNYTTFPQSIALDRLEENEPVERELCSGCRNTMVEVPKFAADLLRSQQAKWPKCSSCRERDREREQREEQERKRSPRQSSFTERPKRTWRAVLGPGQAWPMFGNEELLTLARRRHRELIQKHHPDKGGDPVIAAEINAALDEAEQELDELRELEQRLLDIRRRVVEAPRRRRYRQHRNERQRPLHRLVVANSVDDRMRETHDLRALLLARDRRLTHVAAIPSRRAPC